MEQNLMDKKKAIMVSLASIAENFSKIVTPELNQIWCEALKPLSFDQIAEGTRRCLLECEYFPPIAASRDKAIRGRTLALLTKKVNSLKLNTSGKVFRCQKNLRN